MTLSELTDAGAVHAAIVEFDRIGRDAFLHKYGYGQARNYLIDYKGKHYDSKAVAGAAFGYQHEDRGPLKPSEFSGGDATVRRQLEALGFTVVGQKPDATLSFSEVIARVLELQVSWTSQNTPEMDLRGKLIRQAGSNALRHQIEGQSLLGEQLSVEGRDGTGLKTRVPWIRLYLQSRSPSATNGWYLVYLFARDGSAVYLSLNQGTTSIAGGDFHSRPADYLKERVTWAKRVIDEIDTNRYHATIALADPGGLGAGYEQGNVFALRYDADAIPEDQTLAEDFIDMLPLLARLYEAESRQAEDISIADDGGHDSAAENEAAWTLLVDRTLWPPERLSEVVEALEGQSRQIVLAGPPGTGKSTVAIALARYLTNDRADRWRLVQFHPTYAYEEFVEGLRPTIEGGIATFKVQPGIIKEMAKEATVHPDQPYVLIIDEMNRANLPRVLGELMFLLEYRDQPIDLQYSRQFSLPGNLFIIGTMNTADRSIRSIDIALRRRFEIFDCPPDAGILQRFYDHNGQSDVPGLIVGFNDLNAALASHLDRHHAIGHTFFMTSHLTSAYLGRVWKRQLGPLIEEYFFDQLDVAAEFTVNRFWPKL